MNNIPRLLNYLFEHKSDPNVDQPCRCQREGHFCTTRCKDCSLRHVMCSNCFIERHRANPTHWAEVWDARGYFVTKDIAELGHSIHLGHDGLNCPSPATGHDVSFIIVDTNGIHHSKVRFCGCRSSEQEDRVAQLMSARLFPSTLTRPTMAFTFNVLKSFHLHHLQSKESAGDFVESLRRLTDNAFTWKISVSG